MVIHWVPCYDHRPLSCRQPEPDKITAEWLCYNIAVDFSDTNIIEYELEPPVTNLIHKAWREDGVLHLQMPALGNLREPKTIDHGTDEVITWRNG